MESSNMSIRQSSSLQSLAKMPESIRNVLTEQHYLLERKIENAENTIANPESTRTQMKEVINALCKELHRVSHFITLEDSIAAQLCKMEQNCAAEKTKYANETREARLASLEERVHRKSFEEAIRVNYDEEVKQQATALLDKHTKEILEANTALNEEKIMLAEELHQVRASNAMLQKENAALREEMETARSVQVELTTRSVRQRRTITALKKQLSEAEEKTTQMVAEYDAKMEKQSKMHTKEITPLTKTCDEAQRQARRLHAELTRVRELASRVMESRTELEQFFYDALAQVKEEVIAERRRALAELPCGISNKNTLHMSMSNSHTKSSLLRLECQHKGPQKKLQEKQRQQQLQLQHEDRLMLTDCAHSQKAKESSLHTIRDNNNKSTHALPTCHLSPSTPSSSYSGLLPSFDKRRQWTLDKKGFPVLISEHSTIKAAHVARTNDNAKMPKSQNELQHMNMKPGSSDVSHHATPPLVAPDALILSQHCPLPAYLALSSNLRSVKEHEVQREKTTTLPLTTTTSSSTMVAPESVQTQNEELHLQINEEWQSQKPQYNEITQNEKDVEFAQRLTTTQWREIQNELSLKELTPSNALEVVPQANSNATSQLLKSHQNHTLALQSSSFLALSNKSMNSATTLSQLETVNVSELSWADKERVIQYLFYLLQRRKSTNRCKQITAKNNSETTKKEQNSVNNNQENNNDDGEHDANLKCTENTTYSVAVPDDHVFLTQGAIDEV